MDKISVNIVSSKLTKKGRRTEKFMLISFGLLILCYPIYLLMGKGFLYKAIVILIFLNILFWVIYFYFIDKYETIGHIIFDADHVTVKEIAGDTHFKIADIKHLTITYHGYADEPFLTFYRPYLRNSTGHDNVLSFQSDDKAFKYRFAILNKTVKIFLYQQVENYKKQGLVCRIIE